MTQVLGILRRPQFALLRSLVLPGKIKMGTNGLKSIAKACPVLEELDVGH